ncbi:MAG: hypothetical protein ACREA0_09560, partial [bacterium]
AGYRMEAADAAPGRSQGASESDRPPARLGFLIPMRTGQVLGGPRAELIEFAGIGHAPMITTEAEIDALREWLLRA